MKREAAASKISRRSFLKHTAKAVAFSSFAAPLSLLASPVRKRHIVVIGAGAFGGWTALHLLRGGARVTLLDAYGPGNSRASSGGETRVIRAIYGPNRIYTQWTIRSLQLWKESELRWKRGIYTQTGVLWMIIGRQEYEESALPLLREAGLQYEETNPEKAARRYPQANFDGIDRIIIEKDAGHLLARQACRLVLEAFLTEGGEYKQLSVLPGRIERGEMESISAGDSTVSADQYIFACGPWLGKIFPDVLANLIKPTRQEVFFFGTPFGDTRFDEPNFPVWVQHGERLFYGIPGNQHRGFKVADDTHGPSFDPDSGERLISQEKLRQARDLIEFRFPALKDAPLLESRVCQYENSPDGHFIIDRHPQAENVWLVGGGSGHGYKHGPALGEYVADVVLDKKTIDPFFQLSRFTK